MLSNHGDMARYPLVMPMLDPITLDLWHSTNSINSSHVGREYFCIRHIQTTTSHFSHHHLGVWSSTSSINLSQVSPHAGGLASPLADQLVRATSVTTNSVSDLSLNQINPSHVNHHKLDV